MSTTRPPRQTDTAVSTLRNRIVGHGEVSPAELRKNARNWRVHPAGQKALMREMLRTIGFVAPVRVNRLSGVLVDGHLRAEIALEDHEPTIPVDYVELDPAEEAAVLALFDPLGGLAGADPQAQLDLLLSLEVASEDAELDGFVQQMIDETTEAVGAAARLDQQTSPDSRGRAWGIGKRGDIVKIGVMSRDLRLVESALQATGVMNRGEALAIIARGYLESIGAVVIADDDPALPDDAEDLEP